VLIILPAFFKYQNYFQKVASRPNTSIVYLYSPTRGPLETAYKGLIQFHGQSRDQDPPYKDEPIVFVDGDTYYTLDLHAKLSEFWADSIEATTGALLAFHEPSNQPHDVSTKSHSYIMNHHRSYVVFDPKTLLIQQIAEKQTISQWAVSGCYTFKNSRTFVEHAMERLCDKTNHNYYFSCIFATSLTSLFYVIPIDKTDVVMFNTPEDVLHVHQQSSNQSRPTPKRICFDLDGTLVSFPRIAGDYSSVEPIEHAISYVRLLKDHGHTIIIHTARRMKTHHANVGAVIKDIARVTLDTLDKYNIPYDELYFGKPEADFYVDDRAINFASPWDREMGFYSLSSFTKPRSFNNIAIDPENATVKKSAISTHIAKIQAERDYYMCLPREIQTFFPRLVGHGETFYTMSLVKGTTLSMMYTRELMTQAHLVMFMKQLQYMHTLQPQTQSQMDVTCSEVSKFYRDKLCTRVSLLSNTINPVLAHSCEIITEFLETYTPTLGIIHGDPVLTNVIYQEEGDVPQLVFIDPMGVVGEKHTIYGDIMYDYAKVYQSLCGYDEVLEDRYVSFAYKQHMLEVFKGCIVTIFPDDYAIRFEHIKTLTKYLILCLLPLHEARVAGTMQQLLMTM
jgi:capsule biosynthesis phosphatase